MARSAVVAFFLIAGLCGAARATEPHIRPLDVEIHGNQIAVRFVLNGAIDPAISRRLESGLDTSINYDLRLLERNRYWFDQFLEAHRLRITAAYDPVRRDYVVRDTWDGAPVGEKTAPDFAGACRLLSERDHLVFGIIQKSWPHKHLYVKMRAVYDSGQFFVLAPISSATDWKKSTTFKIHDQDLR